MDYVSLNQADFLDTNVGSSPRDCNIGLQKISSDRRTIIFERLKSNIKDKAKRSKRKITNLRRNVYSKGSNKASLIVHMVTNSPKDPKNLVFLSLILSGVGFLFPYNCLINASDFFQSKFCGTDIIYSISVAYVLTAVSTVFVNNFTVHSIYFTRRIIFGYVVAILAMSIFTVVIIWLQLFDAKTSYRWTLVTTCFTAIGCATQQSSFYGYTSLLPRRYSQALMIGESLSGVISSVLRISTYILLERSPTIYFLLCIGQLLLCLIIFHLSIRSGFVQHHLQRLHHKTCPNNLGPLYKHNNSLSYQISTTNDIIPSNSTNQNREQIFATTTLESQKVALEVDNPAFMIEGEPQHQDEPPDVESSEEDDIYDPFGIDMESSDAEQSENSLSTSHHGSSSSKSSISMNRNSLKMRNWIRFHTARLKEGAKSRLQIVKMMWPYMTAICLTYFVTLSVFPGVETDIRSSYWRSSFPLVVMLVFNLSDFIGKVVTSVLHKWSGLCLLVSSCARLPLVPLIIFCVIPKPSPFIKGDFWVLFLTSLLGLSNGYLGCLPMLLAPQMAKEHQKEMTGNLMTTAYNLGLTIGVLSAIRIKNSFILLENLGNTTSLYDNTTSILCNFH